METEFPLSRPPVPRGCRGSIGPGDASEGLRSDAQIDLGERPHRIPDVKVLNPYGRVPVLAITRYGWNIE